MKRAKAWPDGPLVFGKDQIIAQFVARRIPTVAGRGFGPCTAIGIIRANKLLGGVVYHEYQPSYSSVMVSYAFERPNWASPSVLCSLFAYPFLQLNCNRIWLLSPRKYRRSRKFIEGIGFKVEGCARKGFGRDDAIIYGMLKDECRWIREIEE